MSKSTKGASAPSQFVSAIFAKEIPEGLTLEEFSWANVYQGTESAFVESGFIKPEWLPGKPGNAKKKVKVGIIDGEMRVIPARTPTTDDQWVNGFIRIIRESKGKLTVSVNCLPAELEKREKIEFAESRKEKIKDAHAEIEKEISSLPANPEAFIRRTQHTVRCFASIISNGLADGCGFSGGYRLSSDVIAAFEAGAARAIQLIQEAHIHFDPQIRQKEIADIKDRVWVKYRLSPDHEERNES